MASSLSQRPLGVFDSDIGGLSVVAEIRKRSPEENLIYYADTRNYPYGTKRREEVQDCFANAADELVREEVKGIFCACSTASAVAVPALKSVLKIPLFGLFNDSLVEVVEHETPEARIGLIATELTVRSRAFEALFEKSGRGFRIEAAPAMELVYAVTRGDFSDEAILPVIEKALAFFERRSIGALLIGCTHFYHVVERIRKKMHPCPVVEPARVAVGTLENFLRRRDLLRKNGSGRVRCRVTGDRGAFRKRVEALEAYHGFRFIDEWE
jgi:glutamate racemase